MGVDTKPSMKILGWKIGVCSFFFLPLIGLGNHRRASVILISQEETGALESGKGSIAGNDDIG